jgi:hypothetical protein
MRERSVGLALQGGKACLMHGRDVLLGVFELGISLGLREEGRPKRDKRHMELNQYFGKPEVAVRSVKL